MTRRPIPPDQMELLAWQPPATVTRFEDREVRAATIAGTVCRAVSVALRDCRLKRPDVAERMSGFLGEDVGLNILNAYASPARPDHTISMTRFAALLHVTQDRRLLELLAEPHGWAVIDRKFLKLIEIAALQEREDELRRNREALRRTARNEGLLK